jgi:hypothetical protein
VQEESVADVIVVSKERLGDIAISGGYSSSVRRPLFDKPGSIRKSIPGL